MSHLLLRADARRLPLADRSVHCCVTSPPYYALRDYKVKGQIGLEKTPSEFVAELVKSFREVWRVLRDDGSLWCNIGDSYARNPAKGKTGTPNGRNMPEMGYSGGAGIPAGAKEKDLLGIPWMLAFALRDDGWYLRGEQIWDKSGGMPESVRDRPGRSHEQVFLLAKKVRYFYDDIATRRPQSTLGRRHEGKSGYRDGHPSKGGIKVRALNPLGAAERSVWRLSSGGGYKGAHFARDLGEGVLSPVRLTLAAGGGAGSGADPARREHQMLAEVRRRYRVGRGDRMEPSQCHRQPRPQAACHRRSLPGVGVILHLP
jgi:hypothetical protein